MQFSDLFASVTTINGVGDKAKEALERLGCYKVIDPLFHLPSNIHERKLILNFTKIESGTYITTKIKIENIDYATPAYRKKRSYKFKILCANDYGYLNLVFFNYYPEYLVSSLKIGDEKIISGKIERYGTEITMPHPDYVVDVAKQDTIPKVDIIYPLTYAITSRQIAKLINSVLYKLPKIEEWLSLDLLQARHWQDFSASLLLAHHPQHYDDLSPQAKTRERLAFDEILANQLALQLIRKYRNKVDGRSMVFTGQLQQQMLKNLGFNLTSAQEQALIDIAADQRLPYKMMRLLQGDVGSGKTLVALSAILNVVEANKQATLMAPTDILANQHFEWIQNACKNLAINVVLLTGKIKGKARTETLQKIVDNKANIIIGTHALFQDKVLFNDLGLIVIDEQHRFGVEQRLALSAKGEHADILVMSATPIPRTLTLAIYGDMDISFLKEKPHGRLPIHTSLISAKKINEVIQSIEKLINLGEKIYWICPLIEEQNKEDSENKFKKDLTAAIARFNELNDYFPGKVGLIHGKMKAAEKETAMQEFANGNHNILVATTVIEVGIDVKDASIIIIEQAERFGLSQLHQLRGRVGRGSKQSYCILLYSYPISDVGKERLKVIRDSNDGFAIADADLKLRGAGDVLGTKQSGLPDFKFTSPIEHQELFEIAREQAKIILDSDPKLSSERGKNLQLLLQIFGYNNSLEYVYSG